MTEHDANSPRRTASSDRRDLLLAIIEHASRPIAYVLIALVLLVWLLTVRDPVSRFLIGVSKVDILGVQLVREAKQSNVISELRGLRDLNDEQINLFLVIGRKREHIRYEGPEPSRENLCKLLEARLLSDLVPRNSCPVTPNDGVSGPFTWTVSAEGHRLHQIIFDQILRMIRSGDD